MACEHACNEAIAILLGISNLGETNNYNQTALHLAARSTSVSHQHTQELVTQMILHHDWTVVHIKVLIQHHTIDYRNLPANSERFENQGFSDKIVAL